jgi:hypothetical protein
LRAPNCAPEFLVTKIIGTEFIAMDDNCGGIFKRRATQAYIVLTEDDITYQKVSIAMQENRVSAVCSAKSEEFLVQRVSTVISNPSFENITC